MVPPPPIFERLGFIMGKPSKKTIAESAVKVALEAAQAFADVTDPEGETDALQAADEALAEAEAAVSVAGLDDQFATTLETARVMIGAAPPEPAAPTPPVVDYHTIAPGKSITTKRGILGPGVRIDAKDLPEGDKALKAFVKSGHVLKPAG